MFGGRCGYGIPATRSKTSGKQIKEQIENQIEELIEDGIPATDGALFFQIRVKRGRLQIICNRLYA
jgi:predicted DNA-binding protein